MPANGETVTLPTSPSIPVGISLGLLKREMAQGMWGRHARPRSLTRRGLVGRSLAGGGPGSSDPCSSLKGFSPMPRSRGSCTAP